MAGRVGAGDGYDHRVEREVTDRQLEALLARLDCELISDRDSYVIRAIKRLNAHELAA